MPSTPSSPCQPPSHCQPNWRTRFVLSASANSPKVSLVGSSLSHLPPVVNMAASASAALASGVVPELVDDGLGGTYFISRRGVSGKATEKICVFKPRDEEPNAINNPKQRQQASATVVGAPGLKGGIRVGDAALNEWAGTRRAAPSPTRHEMQASINQTYIHPALSAPAHAPPTPTPNQLPLF